MSRQTQTIENHRIGYRTARGLALILIAAAACGEPPSEPATSSATAQVTAPCAPRPTTGTVTLITGDRATVRPTWHRTPVGLLGDEALAVILHPPGTRFVSLRSKAIDAQGSAVDQTIIRAYGISAR